MNKPNPSDGVHPYVDKFTSSPFYWPLMAIVATFDLMILWLITH